MFNDFREFINKTEEVGECQLIEGADWDLEMGILTELKAQEANSPLLMFDNIKGYPPGYRVASNLFSTPGRIALGAGLPPDAKGIDLVRAMRDKIRDGINPLPPVEAGRRYVELAGGAAALLEHARAAFERAEYRWVAEVLNHLVFAQPDHDGQD